MTLRVPHKHYQHQLHPHDICIAPDNLYGTMRGGMEAHSTVEPIGTCTLCVRIQHNSILHRIIHDKYNALKVTRPKNFRIELYFNYGLLS